MGSIYNVYRKTVIFVPNIISIQRCLQKSNINIYTSIYILYNQNYIPFSFNVTLKVMSSKETLKLKYTNIVCLC